MRDLIRLSVWILLLGSCKDKDAPFEKSTGEQLYFNGSIYTVKSEGDWADAMLVRDGIIIAIGSEAEVEKSASNTAERINLRQKTVLPGLHDVHMHPLEASSSNVEFSLNTSVTNPENYIADIRHEAAKHNGAGWLLGWGFDIHTLLKAQRKPLTMLDEISTTIPIAIMEQSSHAVWVNSKALEIAGLDNNSSDPQGGVLMRWDDQSLNGILIDNAGNIIMDLAIASISGSEQNDYEGLLNFGLPELASNGITSVCDARTYWKRNHHKTWRRIANENRLTARVNLGLWLYPEAKDQDQLNSVKDMYSYDSSSLLKINQVKLYMDGIVTNTTAAMKDDYVLNMLNRAENRGLNYFTQKRVAEYISALEPVGFDFHIHALGNRGVHEALNAIEQSGTSNGRHRLTHIEYVLDSDYDRFKKLNVTGDAQVVGEFTEPEFWHENDPFIGSDLNNANVPIRSLTENGARITLSSDWDVSDLNPFLGIEHAVTRNPQHISLHDAISGYTIHAAYVMRQEHKVGSLEVGKEADFIIVNQNIFDIDPAQISKTKVLETYLMGTRIFPN